jgi:hypothetical protein
MARVGQSLPAWKKICSAYAAAAARVPPSHTGFVTQ